MTTIKKCNWENKKKVKILIGFLSANKINSYNRGGKKKKIKRKKSKRIYRTSQKMSIINVFLEPLLSESFPLLGVTATLPPKDALQHCADLWTCCGGKSDSNLALLLCLLASNVHSYQSLCIFFCGSSQWPFMCSVDTESA